MLLNSETSGQVVLIWRFRSTPRKLTLVTLSIHDCCPKRARAPNFQILRLLHSPQECVICSWSLKSCCGIDVHKKMIKDRIAKGPIDSPPECYIRTYSAMIQDLWNFGTGWRRMMWKQLLWKDEFLLYNYGKFTIPSRRFQGRRAMSKITSG